MKELDQGQREQIFTSGKYGDIFSLPENKNNRDNSPSPRKNYTTIDATAILSGQSLNRNPAVR